MGVDVHERDDVARHSGATRPRVAPAAGDLVAEIDLAGSVCLPSAVSPGWLARVRTFAAATPLDRHEMMIEGAAAAELPFIRDLTADADLRHLAETVAQLAFPDGDPDDQDFDCAIRIIDGPDPQNRPLWLHYDASVLTIVLPITVPDAVAGRSGELVLCPNRRDYRRSVLTNLAEKVIAQSDVYRRRFVRRLRWGLDTEIVSMVPGNAYLFWGYRSYHATLPCAPGTRRVTVVLHYKNVHGDSRLLGRAKALRALLRSA
jgi:hypothetical protein